MKRASQRLQRDVFPRDRCLPLHMDRSCLFQRVIGDGRVVSVVLRTELETAPPFLLQESGEGTLPSPSSVPTPSSMPECEEKRWCGNCSRLARTHGNHEKAKRRTQAGQTGLFVPPLLVLCYAFV